MSKQNEKEVFGVTYDRYILYNLHQILTRDLGLKTIVEMPSHGAKAAGSLYSLGFGKAGCDITLVNPEQNMMHKWHYLGMDDRVTPVYNEDVYHTRFKTNQFDLAWNFVTWTELEDTRRFFAEMKRISKKYVLLVTCNNFQPGYPWHRFLHEWYGFRWNHGEVKHNHMSAVKKQMKQAGLKVLEYGSIDSPGWPDPSGPRDVRLHRRFSEPKKNPTWEVPIVEYIKQDAFPGWMTKLGKIDIRFRKGILKLPMSHLFYVLARKH